MSQAYYSGPAKVFLSGNSVALQPNGENGAVKFSIDEKTSDIATAMFGKIGETLDSQMGEIETVPFDSWHLLPTLFPPYLGVTTASGTGNGAGALVIGTRPHGNANVSAKIYTPDGRLYVPVRAAVTGHPNMKFNSGEALFTSVKISCLGDPAKSPGDSAFLLTGNAITESAASDPGDAFALTDFVRGRWSSAWGTLAGFGGDGGAAMEGEDGFELVPAVKYDPLTVSKILRHMKLATASFMIKLRPVGPTQTQIATALLAHTAGSRFGAGTNAADLILTGPNSKTVTLKQCEIKGAGFEFGGTKLGNGEIGFVPAMTFNTGAPQPQLIFSA